jgi:diguanylate cyclase (GGDEF)-like protein/PAS domain S-box-containing protein
VDQILRWLIDPAGVTPHGFCLLWQPGLLWTHVIADFTTGAAYFAISMTMAVIVRRRQDLGFRPLAWLFIAFILLCGFTHWLDVLTIWVPAYGVQGIVKAATAAVSVAAAAVLWRLMPTALAQPSLEQFRALNDTLRTNRDFLDRIGKVAGVGGWEFDVAADRVVWSTETYRLHGVSPDHHQPDVESSIAFYAPEARPVLHAAFDAGVRTGEAWDLELPFDRADGKRIWVRAVGAPTVVAGAVTRITGAFQDVTEIRNGRLALQTANERAILAADSGGIGIWEWDIVADTVIWDDGMYRLYGLEPDARVDGFREWSRWVHPDDRVAVEAAVADAIAQRQPFDREVRIRRQDGLLRHIRCTGHITSDPNGEAVRMIGANWDITASKRLAEELAAQHGLLQVTLDSIGDGVITTAVDDHVTWLNPVAAEMTGWTADEARSQPLSYVFNVVSNNDMSYELYSLLSPDSKTSYLEGFDQKRLISRDGREFGIQQSTSPILNGEREIIGKVIVFRDVTEQRRLTSELSYRASHDPLTGLKNRTEFELRLTAAVQRAQTGASPGALMLIDLDRFKIVNDACGHAVGDQLLTRIAELLQEAVRASDTVARLGGDEFAILLDDCSLAAAERVAQDVCDRLNAFRFVWEDKRFRIGASIGLAPLDGRWSSALAIRQAADSACYAAKDAGGNRVHVWRDSDKSVQARRRQIHWASRIETALDEDRFRLFHQRIAPLGANPRDGKAEVLLRMLDEEGALVGAAAFMPAAERFQLASRIDRWVLTHAIEWMQSRIDVPGLHDLSVNLSGQSVGDRTFHSWVSTVLDAAGPAVRSRLCLEITETAAVSSLTDAAAFIGQMREMGVRIALDDFGAGASSFRYLKQLGLDFLKIDGQFIQNLLTDALDAAAVRCFVDVAKTVNVKTIAEFVDRPELVPVLTALGVDFAQGYLFHRPAPLEEFFPIATSS